MVRGGGNDMLVKIEGLFKSLGSLRNVLILPRKALFFSMKITLN